MDKTGETKVFVVDKNVEDFQSCSQIVDAARLIQAGEVVAFPTETVYGLGANALSDEAVEKIYKAKGRPGDNPLIVHIGEMAQLSMVAREVPGPAQQLIEAFWPGPLTLVLPKTDQVASLVTAGLDTVGVRMPDNPVALALIRAAGVPIAAPSANRSGRPSPTTAEHVRVDLEGRIAAILDGGSTGVGVESTVLDLTVQPPMILRPGGVTREQLQEVIGEVAVDPAFEAGKETPRSPGMKYTHYAPQGEMWLVAGEEERVRAKMAAMLEQARQSGLSTGVLGTAESVRFWREHPSVDVALACGSRHDLHSVARELYGCLRQFDDLGIQYIVAEAFPRTGMGMAVMNRLEKAAGGRFLSV
ncbi:threonylcarbamoyl-AMP synthase [Brevibacillus sp. SYP-B805]|uniref:L-threonylcarbamoyladenylate synthase n=1 Tax=Brevibacillus sp. SYP-B805 TaxID=1578199 RepID=UPI0013EDA740|nr:L-threonylcarbamoyladenylate synthase [Brevibacillus sp. SYP-B805]NGQ95544.1 threonylcarbamoyl-AMP synthase [Brevibacillus sp. SYP-B805]